VRAGGVLIVLALLAEGITLGLALKDLRDGSNTLSLGATTLGRSPANWTADRVSRAREEAGHGYALVRRGRGRLDGDPLLGMITALPWAGEQVRAVRDLGTVADSSAAALSDYLTVARRFEAERSHNGAAGPRLVGLLGTTREPLTDASNHLNASISTLNQDNLHPLLPAVRDRVESARRQLQPLAAEASLLVAASRLIPTALGAGSPRTYLLLFVNPSEIRPAGGFVGAAGSLTLFDGAIQQLDIRAEEYFTPLFKQKFDAPYPLPRYFDFKKAPYEIGDVGWDPQFANDAQVSEAMFGSATSRTVDGTLAIDPYAISAALAIAGSVQVPGIGTFDQQNFFPSVNYIVNVKTGPGSGKSALPFIARAIVERVLTMPLEQWPRLLAAEQDQARGRHIQVYLHDPELAASAAKAHYDGAILPAVGDSLMVVDGNVGATKGDYYVRKAIDVKAELTASGVSRHQLTLTYLNPLPVDATDRALNQTNAGAYSDYLRLYLPETTSSVQVKYSEDGGGGFGGLDRIDVAGGKRVVAIFFHLPRGHLATIQVNYDVALDGGRAYRLDVQKEAGIPDRKMTLEISYPGGLVTRKHDGATDAEFTLGW
jgi:Protein of unknown function (DUF4012)